MSAHDKLKAVGITPTIDAEKAYQLGYAIAMNDLLQEMVLVTDESEAAKRDLRKTTDEK